jgi:dTDP-4-dehydrorhamnose reductase
VNAGENNAGLSILVAGASGQLARSLTALSSNDTAITALGRPDLDILDRSSIRDAMERICPQVVVNAAAYTAVDRAESEPDQAFAINRDGAGNLAAEAALHGIPIIHISTDYVFDGSKTAPYVETDRPAPQGVYGHSKYEGELAVADTNPHHVILRTSWVYSEYGGNFVKTMLRLASEKPELRVVADQHGNPTHAGDLAEAILKIAGMLMSTTDADSPWGVYHLAGQGEITWHGFAQHIVDCAARFGLPPVPVIPISTAEFPTPAKRPANSQLDCSKAKANFGTALPLWQDSVRRCVETLMNNLGSSKTGEPS